MPIATLKKTKMAAARLKRTDKQTAIAIFFLWLPSCSGLQLDCGPGGEAREGSDHTLTCEGIQSGETVHWMKKRNPGGDISVANCTATTVCENNFQTRYDVTRENDVTSRLRINGVTRDDSYVEGEWTCTASLSSASCVLMVIYVPDMGSCGVHFDEFSKQVMGQCSIHKVYPLPECRWSEQRQDNQAVNVPANQTSLTSTQYVDASNSQIYFRATCHLHRPLPVTPGTYSYKVAITPGQLQPHVVFTSTDIIRLPTSPHISSTCPESYTTDAEAARCTCMTSDLGSPTGTLAWFDPDGNSILSRKTLTLTLPFSYVTSGYNGRPFHCVVLHHTGNSNVSYTPKIAVSPNTPKIESNNSDTTHNIGDVINLRCKANGGLPAIVRVVFTCPGRSDQSDVQEGTTVISLLTFKMSSGDDGAECTCYADNGFVTTDTVTQVLLLSGHQTTSGEKDSSLAVIVTVAVVGFVVIAVVVTSAMVCFWRMRKKYMSSEGASYNRFNNSHGMSSGGQQQRTSTAPQKSEVISTPHGKQPKTRTKSSAQCQNDKTPQRAGSSDEQSTTAEESEDEEEVISHSDDATGRRENTLNQGVPAHSKRLRQNNFLSLSHPLPNQGNLSARHNDPFLLLNAHSLFSAWTSSREQNAFDNGFKPFSAVAGHEAGMSDVLDSEESAYYPFGTGNFESSSTYSSGSAGRATGPTGNGAKRGRRTNKSPQAAERQTRTSEYNECPDHERGKGFKGRCKDSEHGVWQSMDMTQARTRKPDSQLPNYDRRKTAGKKDVGRYNERYPVSENETRHQLSDLTQTAENQSPRSGYTEPQETKEKNRLSKRHITAQTLRRESPDQSETRQETSQRPVRSGTRNDIEAGCGPRFDERRTFSEHGNRERSRDPQQDLKSGSRQAVAFLGHSPRLSSPVTSKRLRPKSEPMYSLENSRKEGITSMYGTDISEREIPRELQDLTDSATINMSTERHFSRLGQRNNDARTHVGRSTEVDYDSELRETLQSPYRIQTLGPDTTQRKRQRSEQRERVGKELEARAGGRYDFPRRENPRTERGRYSKALGGVNLTRPTENFDTSYENEQQSTALAQSDPNTRKRKSPRTEHRDTGSRSSMSGQFPESEIGQTSPEQMPNQVITIPRPLPKPRNPTSTSLQFAQTEKQTHSQLRNSKTQSLTRPHNERNALSQTTHDGNRRSADLEISTKDYTVSFRHDQGERGVGGHDYEATHSTRRRPLPQPRHFFEGVSSSTDV